MIQHDIESLRSAGAYYRANGLLPRVSPASLEGRAITFDGEAVVDLVTGHAFTLDNLSSFTSMCRVSELPWLHTDSPEGGVVYKDKMSWYYRTGFRMYAPDEPDLPSEWFTVGHPKKERAVSEKEFFAMLGPVEANDLRSTQNRIRANIQNERDEESWEEPNTYEV